MSQPDLERMCEICGLGKQITLPERIHGGLLHRMYAVLTTKGKYAIKVLNEEVITRPSAVKNFLNSEEVATVVSNEIPALPALWLNGTFLQQLDGQYFLVYDWIEGESLKPVSITSDHSKKVGALLSDIHRTDFSTLHIPYDIEESEVTDWEYYLHLGKEADAPWVPLFDTYVENLYRWTAMAKKASEILSSEVVISHRDLDPKNVLWSNGEPIVIDWESAGYINPMQDLLETAVYWAMTGEGKIDKERFFSFIDGYKKTCEPYADWKKVLATGFSGKLGWLEYNLKRSLKLDGSLDEGQKMGTDQVLQTLNEIKQYADSLPTLENWLQEKDRG
ncbi:aminoglycoside phosphotransferase family protein [Alkalihalobacillus sp. CinArs1]|uniref:aminoglycoside phosphotransferase family protein n=1 Tax=Alkalihalobacillus sp. CinArs1 TaxID=2995314 RepID=UPI0022DD2E15|nr:aminoglycoside phosphotransferase family protein [Alkalihalobacillus sp. CinArs1]